MVEEKVDINCEPSVGLNFIAAVQSAQAWILAVRETLPFHDCPWRALFLPHLLGWSRRQLSSHFRQFRERYSVTGVTVIC